MRLSSRKLNRGSKLELCMTSMIDVIFLLLIFFMVNSSFHFTERNLDTNIQARSRTARVERVLLEPVIIDIVRTPAGPAYQVGGRHLTSLDELNKLLNQIPNKGKAFVRVSNEAPFAMVASAIQACHSARFLSVEYIPDTN
jgi:biopolymer transport protein ExbD